MNQWKKKWTCETDKMNNLLDRVNKLRNDIPVENPKHIPTFENIYMRPQNSNSSIIEGFGNNLEGFFSPGEWQEDEDVFEQIKEKAQEKFDDPAFSLKAGKDMFDASYSNFTSNIQNNIDGVFAGLADFQDLDTGGLSDAINSLSATEFDETIENVAENFKLPGGIKKALKTIPVTILHLSKIVGNLFRLIAENIQLAKLYLQYYIVYINDIVKLTITKISNALTNNTATDHEINVFQDQTGKFLTMLLVWFFVYNWYYIVFFIQEEDDVRYKFNTREMKIMNPLLFGAFGPALRVIELFNSSIMKIGNYIQNELKIPNAVILFVLFWVFFILVNMNFQMIILVNFFNSISGQYTFTLITLLAIIIVFWTCTKWFWGPEKQQKRNTKTGQWEGTDVPTGNMFMFKLVQGTDGSFISLAFWIMVTLFLFLFYVFWNVAVNIPLALFLVTSYLVVYTFFGVFFYEGTEAFYIYSGITDSVSIEKTELEQEYCKPENDRWWTGAFWAGGSWVKVLQEYSTKFINRTVLNMFEIFMILILLGGIGKYNKEWIKSLEGKIQLNPFQQGGMTQTFESLFFWLILINVLIIIIISMLLYNKFKITEEASRGATNISKDTKLDLTSRSRLAGERPGMKSSQPKFKRPEEEVKREREENKSNKITLTGELEARKKRKEIKNREKGLPVEGTVVSSVEGKVVPPVEGTAEGTAVPIQQGTNVNTATTNNGFFNMFK